MILNQHSELRGKHAAFGGSNWRWINYEADEDFIRSVTSAKATDVGTGIHNYAAMHIKHGLKIGNTHDAKNDLLCYLLEVEHLPEYAIDIPRVFGNMRSYVNDCIGFHMTPEVILKYSDDVFGTADAISVIDNHLQIHDLKTGVLPAHMEQLMVYAALYCLEYRVKPKDIDIDLRIYQNDEIVMLKPESTDIQRIMEQAIKANKLALKLKGQAR